MSWNIHIQIKEEKKLGKLYGGIWVFLACMSYVITSLLAMSLFSKTMEGLELLLMVIGFPVFLWVIYLPYAVVFLGFLSWRGKFDENEETDIMKKERLPRTIATVRTRKIWGWTGYILFTSGLLMTVFTTMISGVETNLYYIIEFLLMTIFGVFAIQIALFEKVWAYLRDLKEEIQDNEK